MGDPKLATQTRTCGIPEQHVAKVRGLNARLQRSHRKPLDHLLAAGMEHGLLLRVGVHCSIYERVL